VPREQKPPAGRRGVDLTNELLLELLASQLRFERRVMSQLDELKSKIAALQGEISTANQAAGTANAKTDALIALTGDIKDQLAALAAGGGLSPSDLSDVLTSIDQAVTDVHAIGTSLGAESDKVDAAIIADTPVASPAPAPADPPVEASAPAPAPAPAPVDSTDSTDGGTPAAPAAGSSDAPSDSPSAENGTETP
jgi:hypothetical protein